MELVVLSHEFMGECFFLVDGKSFAPSKKEVDDEEDEDDEDEVEGSQPSDVVVPSLICFVTRGGIPL